MFLEDVKSITQCLRSYSIFNSLRRCLTDVNMMRCHSKLHAPMLLKCLALGQIYWNTTLVPPNEPHCVSNYWHIDCLFSILFRLTLKETSTPISLAFCERNPPIYRSPRPVDSVMQKTLLFQDFIKHTLSWYGISCNICVPRNKTSFTRIFITLHHQGWIPHSCNINKHVLNDL